MWSCWCCTHDVSEDTEPSNLAFLHYQLSKFWKGSRLNSTTEASRLFPLQGEVATILIKRVWSSWQHVFNVRAQQVESSGTVIESLQTQPINDGSLLEHVLCGANIWFGEVVFFLRLATRLINGIRLCYPLIYKKLFLCVNQDFLEISNVNKVL